MITINKMSATLITSALMLAICLALTSCGETKSRMARFIGTNGVSNIRDVPKILRAGDTISTRRSYVLGTGTYNDPFVYDHELSPRNDYSSSRRWSNYFNDTITVVTEWRAAVLLE